MAGVKGRSGRRSLSDSQKRHRIIDKSWDLIEKNLDNPELDIKIKLEIASKLVVKDIPNVVEGMETNQTVIMGNITRTDGTPLRYNLGSSNLTPITESPGEAVSGS
jgi:hypothetical protein